MIEPIGLVGTLIAIVQISSKVVSICYEYRRSVKSAPREISQILEEVTSLRNIVERLANIAETDEGASSLPSLRATTDDNGPLAICLSEIESLKIQLKPEKGWKAKGKALLWPLKQVEVNEHLQVIGRVKGTLQLAMSADNSANLIEILASTRNLPTIKDEVSKLTFDLDCLGQGTKFRRIIDWLSAPDLAPKHESERQKHIPGSGQWFLQHEAYQAWKRGSEPTIWLKGFTGCGKTVLCAAIIEDVSRISATSPSTATAYIYFDANGGHKYDTAMILRTIISQLIPQLGSLPTSLVDLYEESDTKNDFLPSRRREYAASRENKPILAEFERVLQHQLDELQHLYLVFDAMDECEDFEQIHCALQIINKISKVSLGDVHVLATSRYLPEIEDCFNDLDASCIKFEIDKVNHDIRQYIRTAFSDDARLSRWPNAMQQEVETELMAKAQGMFRWADCQLQVLRRCKTPSAIRETLGTLPKTLDETYSRVLSSIDPADVSLVQRLLQWLVGSFRPLRLSELNEALAIDMDTQDQPYYDSAQECLDKRDILSLCSSLVATTDVSSHSRNASSFNVDVLVRLAHSSVRDFLASPSILSTACYRFSVTEGAANAYLARACMAYLRHLEVVICAANIGQYSLVEYAATCWVPHAKRSNAAVESQTSQDLVWSMFDPERIHYRNWIQFNNLEKPWRTPDLSGNLPTIPPLYAAANLGFNMVCKALIGSAVDVNASGGHLGNALSAAAFKGHAEIVQTLLHAGTLPNIQGGYLERPLAAAASQGHNEVVALLVNNGADPNKTGRRNNPLYAAATQGSIECCRLLLHHGARDYWSPKAEPRSALHVATLAGHNDIVRLMLSKFHETRNHNDDRNLETAQEAAGSLGNLDILKELLAYGVRPNDALKYAARVGDQETFQTLLDEKSDALPSTKMWEEQRGLCSAARGGHTAMVREMLSRGVDPNMNSSYYNILSAAAEAGNVEIIHMLVAAGANVNPSDNHHIGPLTTAARHGEVDAIRVLVEHGADLNAENYEALFAATNAGRLDAIKKLVGLGAELPLHHPESTRLMGAVAYGGTARIVKYFFEQGVNPKKNVEEDEDGGSFDPLINAIEAGRPEIVLALLDGGMNVNRIVQLATPLSAAIRWEDALLAAQLLDRGADVNLQKSRTGTTPLLEAINLGMVSMVKLLLERQADPNQHGTINRNQPKFPLLLAAEKGYVDIGRLLLKYGALVDEQDEEGFSALHGAAGHSHHDFIKMLIEERHADPTVRLANGSMPIHTAAARGNPQSIDLFLDVGIDVNASNNDGRTPLHWAAEKCQWDDVKLLLEKGANTDLKADGELALTALDLAYIGRDDRYNASSQRHAWSEEDVEDLLDRL